MGCRGENQASVKGGAAGKIGIIPILSAPAFPTIL